MVGTKTNILCAVGPIYDTQAAAESAFALSDDALEGYSVVGVDSGYAISGT